MRSAAAASGAEARRAGKGGSRERERGRAGDYNGQHARPCLHSMSHVNCSLQERSRPLKTDAGVANHVARTPGIHSIHLERRGGRSDAYLYCVSTAVGFVRRRTSRRIQRRQRKLERACAHARARASPYPPYHRPRRRPQYRSRARVTVWPRMRRSTSTASRLPPAGRSAHLLSLMHFVAWLLLLRFPEAIDEIGATPIFLAGLAGGFACRSRRSFTFSAYALLHAVSTGSPRLRRLPAWRLHRSRLSVERRPDRPR